MGLLNRNKQTAELTTYQKCQELLKGSTVPADQVEMILEQIKSIIDELEAIGQKVDSLEIVTEVLEQNDFEFLNSKQFTPIERTIKINTSGREVHLTDEKITKLNFEVKLGGAVLDLRNYEFTGGDLLLNIKSSFSGVQVYINQNVAVNDWIENKFSGVDYHYNGKSYSSAHLLPKFETEHTITLEGKIKGSGVSFIIGHQGAIENDYSHQGNCYQQQTESKLDDLLDNKLQKIEEKAEIKRMRLKNRIERKKARLHNNK